MESPITTQLTILPQRDPDDIITEAKTGHDPVATVCLFSGGNDSTVLAHRCRDHYDALVFIDTGTALPGVREFVESYALWLGKPLRVYESGDIYRYLVLGIEDRDRGLPGYALGFPGPAQHGRAYVYLKERALRDMTRDLKVGKGSRSRVLCLSGVRRDESARRAGRLSTSREGSRVYACPLIDWTNADMRAYRDEHGLPESEVAALIHRSGECNCGAFAYPGERDDLRALYPEWFEQTIASLEREAELGGNPRLPLG